MQRNKFGQTGLCVGPLGFGAFGAARDPKTTEHILDIMIDCGVNLIDTAQVYPGSEEFLGNYLQGKQDIVVVTKCGEHEILPDGSMRSKRIDLETIETSLKRLKRDCLDIVLLHSYDLDMLENGETIAVLRKPGNRESYVFSDIPGITRTPFTLPRFALGVQPCASGFSSVRIKPNAPSR